MDVKDLVDDQVYLIEVTGSAYKKIMKLIETAEKRREYMRRTYQSKSNKRGPYVTHSKKIELPIIKSQSS